jgi:DNA-binding PadR family transcriptional regulator
VPITSDVIRGHTDTIILAHLMQGDSYGYRINRDIHEKTGKQYELKEATLYTAFHRLEKEGYIRSYWGDEDQGARRRYYAITDEGKEAFKRYNAEWKEAKTILDALIKIKGEKK